MDKIDKEKGIVLKEQVLKKINSDIDILLQNFLREEDSVLELNSLFQLQFYITSSLLRDHFSHESAPTYNIRGMRGNPRRN